MADIEKNSIPPESFVVPDIPIEEYDRWLRRETYCDPTDSQSILIWTGIEHDDGRCATTSRVEFSFIRCFLTLVRTMIEECNRGTSIDKLFDGMYILMMMNEMMLVFMTSKPVLPFTCTLIQLGLKLPDKFPNSHLNHINTNIGSSSIRCLNRVVDYDPKIWYKQWGNIPTSISELLEWSHVSHSNRDVIMKEYFQCLALTEQVNLTVKPAR